MSLLISLDHFKGAITPTKDYLYNAQNVATWCPIPLQLNVQLQHLPAVGVALQLKVK